MRDNEYAMIDKHNRARAPAQRVETMAWIFVLSPPVLRPIGRKILRDSLNAKS
jgi:hypothetical protein